MSEPLLGAQEQAGLSQALTAWYGNAEQASEVELALLEEWAGRATLDYALLEMALGGKIALSWDFTERCPRVKALPEPKEQVA